MKINGFIKKKGCYDMFLYSEKHTGIMVKKDDKQKESEIRLFFVFYIPPNPECSMPWMSFLWQNRYMMISGIITRNPAVFLTATV